MSIYDNYDTEEIAEDYELQIREILKNVVKTKIKETVEALEHEKGKNKDLWEMICELRLKIRKHEEEMTQAILKTTKEVEKKLIGEFVPHDIVWYADSKRSQAKCTKCEGVGKAKVEVFGKMTTASCPYCQSGTIYTSNYFPTQDIVSSIYFDFHRADRNNKNSEVELNVRDIYLDKRDNSSTKPKYLFKTLEACQAECDALNAKEAEK